MFYSVLQKIFYGVFRLFNRSEIIGIENLPKNEKIIICPNHKSNWDPIFVSCNIKPQIHWMAKVELKKIPILGMFIQAMGAFYVDRGAADIGALKNAMKLLKENEIVGIFPEGTRVYSENPDNAKAGVALIAHRTKAKVVPVYIEGEYRIFKKLRLIIREPISYENLPKKLTTEEYENLSKSIMKKVYNIKELGD